MVKTWTDLCESLGIYSLETNPNSELMFNLLMKLGLTPLPFKPISSGGEHCRTNHSGESLVQFEKSQRFAALIDCRCAQSAGLFSTQTQTVKLGSADHI